jgi:hypothetical protein
VVRVGVNRTEVRGSEAGTARARKRKRGGPLEPSGFRAAAQMTRGMGTERSIPMLRGCMGCLMATDSDTVLTVERTQMLATQDTL